MNYNEVRAMDVDVFWYKIAVHSIGDGRRQQKKGGPGEQDEESKRGTKRERKMGLGRE